MELSPDGRREDELLADEEEVRKNLYAGVLEGTLTYDEACDALRAYITYRRDGGTLST